MSEVLLEGAMTQLDEVRWGVVCCAVLGGEFCVLAMIDVLRSWLLHNEVYARLFICSVFAFCFDYCDYLLSLVVVVAIVSLATRCGRLGFAVLCV